MMSKINLDHAACELPTYEVQKFVRDAMDLSFNPSSVYERGVRNRQIIESVREKIAEMIHCEPEEIYFTSGATEANSWAIDGFLKTHPEAKVFTTTIEHSSIDDNPHVEKVISVDSDGYIDTDNLQNTYDNIFDEDNTLWVIGHANNVIGSIQDLQRFRSIVRKGFLMVDAAQTFGKLPIDVKKMRIDMLSASARKIGGIGGVGFLYINKKLNIGPILYGAQENGLRGGTYNDLAIGAFGVALDELNRSHQTVIKSRRNFLMDELQKIRQVKIIGKRADRLPGVVLFKIEGLDVNSLELVGLFDNAGFMVSTDSACHAGSSVFSHVLTGIGETPETAKTVIRVSLGLENSVQDIQSFIKYLRSFIKLYKE